jgi:hypothetical protein
MMNDDRVVLSKLRGTRCALKLGYDIRLLVRALESDIRLIAGMHGTM